MIPENLNRHDFIWIDGERQGEALPRRDLVDPANGEVIGRVPEAGAAEVDAAVLSAHQALRGAWVRMLPGARGAVMLRLADLIDQATERLARLDVLCMGKPLVQARRDVGRCAAYFRFYAGLCDKLNGETIPIGLDQTALTLLEPVGVTAHILPWNYPISTLARGAAPALAAGATIVAKPAETTPLSALAVAELAGEAGVPPGVFNVVTGAGQTGAALAEHPKVAQVTFTGSTATGRKIMRAAANPIAGVTLELGGKSPVVALPGADPDEVARGIIRGIFFNGGQVCTSGSRLITTAGLHDQIVGRIIAHAEKMTMGHGLDDPDLGPLASAAHLARVDGFVERARAAGLTCVTGGVAAQLPDLPNGAFYRPTIFTDVPVQAEIAQCEVFGPVLCTHIAEDLEEALAISNATPFGLAAGIYTPDVTEAMHFARRVEAGQVFVNGFLQGGDTIPFGGVKESGVGREKGVAAMAAYTVQKSVVLSHPL